MQTQLTLPSKRRVDTHGVLVPFEQLLQPGEVLVEGTCTIQVLTGIDPDPEHMLEGSTQVRGTNLYQQIKLGIPGVIYSVTFVGETDLENSYTVETKQAVLENQTPAGPIYQPFHFTSPPYPLESIEGIGVAFENNEALLWQPPLDAIDVLILPLDGTLRNILRSYSMLPEGIDVEFEALNGTLKDILKFYTMLPEGIDVVFSAQNGTMKDVLITYSNYRPEGINVTIIPLGGTLV